MNAFFDLAWRAYPAVALILLGGGAAGRGLYRILHPPYGTIDALTYTLGFREIVVGLSVVLVGAGWLWRVPVLVAMGLVIGGEEYMETTGIITGLRGRPRTPSGRVVSAAEAQGGAGA